MDRDLKVAKKTYSPPSFQVLDAGAAQAELEATRTMDDENTREMLSVVNRREDGKLTPRPSTAKTSVP